ncbi:hypothetical protein F2Q70_00032791 [Brassica cretica]|uniref:PH domain-containing protein n=1 Tax=Brassica cretica TaxID=69181 RepID=A0A8S9FCW2_BRACR|nr:hypothetical protein F2Q70_00032791 [Brassica cretica]
MSLGFQVCLWDSSRVDCKALLYRKKLMGVPIKTMLIDGNCRVEDRGLKTHHGHMVYVLSVYNKKERHHRITMAAFNIQEALMWKEKIESVIDQHQESQVPNGQQYVAFEYKSGMDNGRTASSSDYESHAPEDEDDSSRRRLVRRTTIGNANVQVPRHLYLTGLRSLMQSWRTRILITKLSRENTGVYFSAKTVSGVAGKARIWPYLFLFLYNLTGLRIFEELVEVDYLPRSCSRAMKAVGVVEATCEEVFELVMSMDGTRYE